MMYATVYMGKEIMEQDIPKKADDLKKFSTEIKREKRSEILKKINDQVKTKLNTLSGNDNAADVCALVNAKVTESKKGLLKGLLKKGGLKSLMKDEHYIHLKDSRLKITDDLKGEKSIKDIDLDNRQHRGLVAGFLTGLIEADVSVKTNMDFRQIMDYIDALDKLESEFSQTMETEETLTKKETRKLRKTLRKDINLDKKNGEFDPLLKVYREGVAAQAEAVQNTTREITEVTPKITSVGLKDSGYAIKGVVTKDGDDFTTSIKNEDGIVKITAVQFGKDGMAKAGEYSGDDGKTYKVEVDNAGKITKVAVVENTSEEVTATPLPTDYGKEPLVDGNSDLIRITPLIKPSESTIAIKDLKVYKSASNKGFRVEGKINDNTFTFYLDDKDKLQVLDGDKLTPALTNPVEIGEYAFTQGSNNEITVSKNEEKEEEDIPEDLSQRTIEQVNESATPEQIKTRLGELIDKVGSVPGKYFPGRNARKDGTYKNNRDIAWIQKGLIEYAKINPDFFLRSDSTFVNGIRSSDYGDEYKYTNSGWSNNFVESDFISGEYDSAFAGSVASFQALNGKGKNQDGLPGEKTLTALQSALNILMNEGD